MVFIIFFMIFGCGMFWVEFNNVVIFLNIGISIWWVIVIIIMVGYGDYYLKSIFGYIMVFVMVLIGLCLIVILIVILLLNFSIFYGCYIFRKKYLNVKKIMKRK